MFAEGDRVRVRLPVRSPCALHCADSIPVEGATGTVVRILAGTDHPIGVWLDLWHLGTRWSDTFRPDELEPLAD